LVEPQHIEECLEVDSLRGFLSPAGLSRT